MASACSSVSGPAAGSANSARSAIISVEVGISGSVPGNATVARPDAPPGDPGGGVVIACLQRSIMFRAASALPLSSRAEISESASLRPRSTAPCPLVSPS